MERARRSLSLLRQAASSRAPPNPLDAKQVAPSSPYESSNPTFDLARAAAPSMELQLQRATAPSMGSSTFSGRSDNGQGSPRSQPASPNPIVAREMPGIGRPNPAASGSAYGASTPSRPPLILATDTRADVEDPLMNKPALTSEQKTGSMINLMKNPQKIKNIVLVPARFIKEKTWGTPRRRACTSVCLLIFFIIFIYLIVRLVDVLKILNSSPSIQEFRVADMCSSSVKMSLAAQVLNPSSSGATVRAMRAEIWMGNASIPNGAQLVGYINTPDIYLGGGNYSLATSLEAEIPIEQAPWVRKIINAYLKNNEVDLIAKIPITASFGPEVFIIPISYSTTIEVKLTLPALNATRNSTENETEPEEPRPRLVKMIELLAPKNPSNYLAVHAALELFTRSDFAKSFLEITAPPLHFDVFLGDEIAVTGKTNFFHYGRRLPANVPSSDFGTIGFTVATGTPNIPAVHFGINRFMEKGKIPVRGVLKGANFSNPEITPYRTMGSECHIQNVLEGVEYELELDVEKLLNPDPVTNTPTRAPTTASPTAQPTAQPYFELALYELVSIQNQAIINNNIAVDTKGLDQLFGIRGVFPPVQIYVDVEGVNATTDPPDNLIYFNLPNSFSFYPNDSRSFVPSIPFSIQFNSATHTIRLVDTYVLNNHDIKVIVRTSSTGSFLSRLLSAAKIEISLKDLLGSDEEDEADSESGSRRLASMDEYVELDGNRELSVWENKSVKLDVTSTIIKVIVELTAKGFDSDFFGGTRIVVHDLILELRVWRPDWTIYGPAEFVRFAQFTLDSFDTDDPSSFINFKALVDDNYLTSEAIYDIVSAMATEYREIQLFGAYRYNGAPGGGGFYGDQFTFKRTPPAENRSSEASPSTSFFEFYHIEMLNLTTNRFHLNAYFGIDLGELKVDVTLPKLSLGFGQCGLPHLVTIALDQWAFQTGGDAAFAPVQIELEDASSVLDVVSTFLEGEPQNLCVRPHPYPPNFLSYFLGTLALDFVLKGRDKSAPNDVGGSADLLNLELTSLEREACLSLKLDLVDPDNPSNTSLSLGWGDIDMRLSVDHAPTNEVAEFLTLQVEEGWFGKIDEYRRDHFEGPSVVKPITATLCFLADASMDLSDAQDATRSVLQRLYDGVAIPINVGGTIKRRIAPAGTAVISGQFTAPASTLDAMTAIGGTTPAADVNATEWFDLIGLSLEAFTGDTLSTKITFETGSIGFNISLPAVGVRIGSITAPSTTELPLFNVDVALPPFGFEEHYPLPVLIAIALIPPQDWGDTLEFVNNVLSGEAKVVVGSTTKPGATLLSKIIPTITISLSKSTAPSPPTLAPTPAPAASDSVDVEVYASSTNTAASVIANVKVLERLPIKIVWETIDCRLFDGNPATANEIGHLFLPGEVLQEANTGPQNVNLTLFSSHAVQFLTDLFNGTLVRIGFQGTIGTNSFTSHFKIPISLTSGGGSGSESGSTEGDDDSSFELLDISILGADSPGSSGTFPCPIEGVCENTIKGDNNGPFQGITAGVTVKLDLPKLGRIRYKVGLQSEVHLNMQANGASIATIVVQPITVTSSQTQLSPIASLRPNNAALPDLRAALSQVMSGYDTAIVFSGATSNNFLSKLASAYHLTIEILDVPEPDPDAPSMLGGLKLNLISSIRTRAVLAIDVKLTFDTALTRISVGALTAEVRFGHSKTCGGGSQWCIGSGHHIATATTLNPLILQSSPVEQLLTLRAELHHSGGVLSPSQQAVDSLVSAYIWGFEMPLELKLTLTPVAGNPYGVTSPFSISLFVTLPAGAAVSEFIDDISVDIMGTLLGSIGDVNIKAVKTLKNTLDFPLVVSYYQYTLKLVDPDGVQSSGCGLFSSGLVGGTNPCGILGLCRDPWAVPTDVGESGPIRSGDPNQIRPGTSILHGGQKYLEPNGGTGTTDLIIDSTIDTTVRLVDEMMTKGTMCGDIDNGIVLVGLQASRTCNDANKLEADVTCTYPLRIKFSLPNYPLSDLDSCGSLMEVPNHAGFDFYKDDHHQFDQSWIISGGPALNPGPGTIVQLLDDSVNSNTRSSPIGINVLDSFEFRFEARMSCSGEAMSLSFFNELPAGAYDPKISCPGNCNGRWASAGIGTGYPYASLVLAYEGCNALAWVVSGNTGTPYRGSQSCGHLLDNGSWGTVVFTYNAHDKRARASYQQFGSPLRAMDFDLDLLQQVGFSQYAYPAIIANRKGSCSFAGYRNIEVRGPRTNGQRTTIEGGFKLMRAGEVGTLTFRARDQNGRKRGKGNNLWEFQIEDSTGNPADQDMALSPRFVDNGDGTYTLRYRIYKPGRYTVRVACMNNGATICNNANVFTDITKSLYVRSAA